MYYTTQAWAVLHECWKGYKIAKGQDDVKRMKYYADGIRKAQKELGLEVDSFLQLGLYAIQDRDSEMVQEKADKTYYDDYDYERKLSEIGEKEWKNITIDPVPADFALTYRTTYSPSKCSKKRTCKETTIGFRIVAFSNFNL
jgi:hypothetical protein